MAFSGRTSSHVGEGNPLESSEDSDVTRHRPTGSLLLSAVLWTKRDAEWKQGAHQTSLTRVETGAAGDLDQCRVM